MFHDLISVVACSKNSLVVDSSNCHFDIIIRKGSSIKKKTSEQIRYFLLLFVSFFIDSVILTSEKVFSDTIGL